jgi:hypothetical protein
LEPLLQKQIFSNSEGEVEANTGFFQQQVLLYSKWIVGKWISGMCSFLNGNNYLFFQTLLIKLPQQQSFCFRHLD